MSAEEPIEQEEEPLSSKDKFSLLTPADFGMPEMPVESVPRIRGRIANYINGMKCVAPVCQKCKGNGTSKWPCKYKAEIGLPVKGALACQFCQGYGHTGKFDWYFVLMHTGNINRYLSDGGDPKRMIVHHFAYDTGVINPLWGTETFKRRVKRMQDEFHIETVVAADFSSWANMPIVVQLQNYYRSISVARDFCRAGFKVLPMVCWSAPQIMELSIRMWPYGAPTIVLDGSHVATGRLNYNKQLFFQGIPELDDLLAPEHILCWCSKSDIATVTASLTDVPVQWVPNRGAVLATFSKMRGAKIAERKQLDGQSKLEKEG